MAKRRRRWFQFSLRSLLLLMAASALVMAVIHQARQQRGAVAALLQSNPGATIWYTYQLDADGHPIADPAPTWFREVVGIDYVSTVEAVEFDYATDADLECVERLSGLRWLTLARSIDMTDEGMRHIGRLRNLRVLTLGDADRMTDKGLAHLERLTSLRELTLDVRADRVSRAAIARLQRVLPKCRIETSSESTQKDGVASHSLR